MGAALASFDIAADGAVLASQIVASKRKAGRPLPPVDLTTALTDIAITDTIIGSSTLTLHLVDPEYALLDSGFFDADADGRLDVVEVNYPNGSDLWWRQTQVVIDWGGVPTIEMIFMERTAVYLLEHHGPLKTSRAKVTRAEFLKMLCDHVKVSGGIEFISAELHKKQDFAPDQPTSAKARKKAKAMGLQFGDPALTVKGSPATAAQVAIYERLLDVSVKLSAPPLAQEALLVAAIGESAVSFQATNGGNGHTYWGVLQGDSQVFKQGDVEGMAISFLSGGRGFNGGGAIKLSADPNQTPGQIATTVEGSGQPANFYGKYLAEADRILQSYGLNGGGAGLAAATYRKQYNFEVGTVSTPRETYWDAMNRLALEVKWPLFVDGPRVYFDPETTLGRAKAAAVITRGDASVISGSTTWDVRNIATQFVITLICDPFEFRAGETLQLVGFGPASSGSTVGLPGRWLISQIDRNVSDIMSTFTLTQPEAPAPEPTSPTATASATGAGGGGGLLGEAQLIGSQNRAYVYGGGHGVPLTSIGSSDGLDCSSSTSLALSRAGFFTGSTAIVSGDFARSWGQPGRGANFTVWANAAHVFIASENTTPGWRFDTVSGNPPGRSGPQVRGLPPVEDLSAFTAKHWPGN